MPMLHWILRALIAATLALPAFPLSLAEDPEELEVGAAVSVELTAADPAAEGHGPSRAFEVLAEFDGSLAIEAHGRGVDPFLVVDNLDRETFAEDDNGGGGQAAAVAIRCSEGETLRIVVCVASQAGETGTIELRTKASPHPPEAEEAIELMQEWFVRARELVQAGDREAARDSALGAFEDALSREGADSSLEVLAALYELRPALENLSALEALALTDEFAHQLTSKIYGELHPQRLDAVGRLAVTRFALGELEASLEMFERHHAGLLQLHPEDATAVIESARNLGGVRFRLGDVEGAHRLFEGAHRVLSKRPEDDPLRIEIESVLAASCQLLGDLDRAHELIDRAHRYYLATRAEDDSDLLRAKTNLALVLEERGELREARELHETVHAVVSRKLPEHHAERLDIELNLAGVRQVLGDLEGARELLEHVHRIRAEALPDGHPDLIKVQQNLGSVRLATGDVEAAHELFEHIHAVRAATLPKGHASRLSAQQNLGITLQRLGDLAGAERHFEEVHDIWSESLPPDHSDLLASKVNLAMVRFAQRDYERAAALLERVHDVWTARYPAEHPDLSKARQNLADTRRALGDVEGASELFEEVYTTWRSFLPQGHPDRLPVEVNVAQSRLALGDRAGALEVLLELVEGMRVSLLRTLATSPREARARVASMEFALFALDLLPQLAAEQDAGPVSRREAEKRVIELCALRRYVSTAHLDATELPPHLEALAASADRARRELGELVSAVPVDAEADALEAWRSRVADLAAERDDLDRRLRQELVRGDERIDSASVASMARGLEEAALAVEFVVLPRLLSDSSSPGISESRELLFAHVIDAQGEIARIELGETAAIESAVGAWRSALGKPVQRGIAPPEGGPASERSAGQALRRLVLDPLLEAFPERDLEALFIVPDGALHLVPFDALPLDGEADERVADVLAIRTELSFARLTRAADEATGEASLLLLGDADFNRRPEGDARLSEASMAAASRSARRGSWRRLTGTRGEVEGIGLYFEERFEREAQLLLRKDATKLALFDLAPGVRYVHLATHGWFTPAEDLTTEGAPVGLDGSAGFGARLRRTVKEFSPLSLCGLCLTGANAGIDDAGRVPGLLTAEELATLDLSACELAVLSACETNVGYRRAGQGVQSLQVALHAAGARTAITSLWKVDDGATKELMLTFYANLWEAGMGKAEALVAAKRTLREEGYDPVDWAGWVLTGEPD